LRKKFIFLFPSISSSRDAVKIAFFIKTEKGVSDILKVSGGGKRMKMSKSIERTKHFIEEHLEESLTLDDIAASVGYSKFHLNKMFAKNTGQTIHKYIRNRRMEEAANRLTETNDSILHIALDSGYESQQSFTSAFKQLYTYTPEAYRRLKSVKENEMRLAA